ncbi:MAG TPA: tripartite tricarboxylate transporter substrate binding protein, partial [Acetobacteraceae bacterium]|nr:tripartite tricarboxylate transporter substrate binding protein [Acetobacteraceae bacterium]
MTLSRRGVIAAMPALAALSPASHAQPAWPERPVRVIVPFPGGSTPDIAARAVAAHFQTVFGQPFVVDNRAGGGGAIGTDAIAKATDGHTIGVSINAPLTTAPALNANLPYDPRRDLAPVSLLVRGAQLLLVHPEVPARDLASFIQHARANPGRLAFGSVGAGSGGHLAMTDIMTRAGIELVHVPYRGFPE